jgi:hypothetical protein
MSIIKLDPFQTIISVNASLLYSLFIANLGSLTRRVTIRSFSKSTGFTILQSFDFSDDNRIINYTPYTDGSFVLVFGLGTVKLYRPEKNGSEFAINEIDTFILGASSDDFIISDAVKITRDRLCFSGQKDDPPFPLRVAVTDLSGDELTGFDVSGRTDAFTISRVAACSDFIVLCWDSNDRGVVEVRDYSGAIIAEYYLPLEKGSSTKFYTRFNDVDISLNNDTIALCVTGELPSGALAIIKIEEGEFGSLFMTSHDLRPRTVAFSPQNNDYLGLCSTSGLAGLFVYYPSSDEYFTVVSVQDLRIARWTQDGRFLSASGNLDNIFFPSNVAYVYDLSVNLFALFDGLGFYNTYGWVKFS